MPLNIEACNRLPEPRSGTHRKATPDRSTVIFTIKSEIPSAKSSGFSAVDCVSVYFRQVMFRRGARQGRLWLFSSVKKHSAIMGSLGPFEVALIALAVLLIFGAKRIPEIARGLGKGIREFKTATREISKEFDVKDTSNQIQAPSQPTQGTPAPRTDVVQQPVSPAAASQPPPSQPPPSQPPPSQPPPSQPPPSQPPPSQPPASQQPPSPPPDPNRPPAG